jgi:soluble lytic murein transglycosylase-like protein
MSFYEDTYYTPAALPRDVLHMLLILLVVIMVISGLVMVRPQVTVAAPETAMAVTEPGGTDMLSGVAETTVAAPHSALAPVFTPEVRYWEAKIVAWAAEFGLDPNLVATIMQVESCGDATAVSRAGAQGLFQVMPFHFSPGEDPFDPDTNARRGMAYFVERLQQTKGDVGRAFAGYNGGHVAAGGSWENWAAETRAYYTYTTGIYADAQAGLSESPALQRWVQNGAGTYCQLVAKKLGL